jgi:hypothetical protein
MNDTYLIVENIYSRHRAGVAVDFEREILELLLREGIKQRQDDGALKQINISKPTSIQDGYVVGLRYIKNDGTQTEDHFLFRKDQVIVCCYRRDLENVLSEYRGTHKMQVQFYPPATVDVRPTQVNTVTFTKGN